MPQSNFNPEKEPTPERKWWNVFERQSEFEQPEKEKQPEQLVERAKELKSAAKKRGHFWETFMPSREDSEHPEEIAPKGEKVRKKWRALLRRKSEKQVDEFKKEDPETIDSYWLAQLMVAERILTLHAQLAESEPKTDERRQIKTELDVLGLLSEKLSDPDVEVPAEIEETYRTIVTVLEQSDQDVEVEKLPVIEDTPEDSPEAPDHTREHSFKKYGTAVIVALKQAVRAKKTPPEDARQPATPPILGRGASQPTPSVSKPLDHAPTPHQTPNVAPGVALTAAVIIAEYGDRKYEKQGSLHTPPRAQTPESPTTAPRPLYKEAPRTTQPETYSQTERTEETPALPEVLAHGSPRKFEHMNTTELLQLAQSVSLGNGEYLARAYQSGKIDRDGLIAVLKTAARRGNYHDEFRRRSGEYIRMRTQAVSPSPTPAVVPAEPNEQPDSTHTSAEPTHASPTSTNTSVQPPPKVQVQAHYSVAVVTFICIVIIAAILLMLL